MLKNTLKLTAVILIIALLSTEASLFAIADDSIIYADRTIYVTTTREIDYNSTYNGRTYNFLGLDVIKIVGSSDNRYRLVLSENTSEKIIDELKANSDVVSVWSAENQNDYVYMDNYLGVTFIEAIEISDLTNLLKEQNLVIKSVECLDTYGYEYRLGLHSEANLNATMEYLFSLDTVFMVIRDYMVRDIYNVGDINMDGKVDVFDCAQIKRVALNTHDLSISEYRRADINGDGTVNAYDYALLKRHYLGTNTLDYVNIQRPE